MSRIIVPSRKLWTPPQRQRGYVVLDAYRMGNYVPWTPPHLTNPAQLWFNDDSSVTDAGGGACSQWNDLSANAYHFVQGTGGNQPLIVAGALNGRRVIRFNGTTGRLYNNSSAVRSLCANKSAAWCMVVYKKAGTDGSPSSRSLFTVLSTDGSQYRLGVMAQASVAAVNKPTLYTTRLDADTTAVLSATSAVSSGSWHIVLVLMDWASGDGTVYVDGEVDAQNLSLTSSGTSQNSTGNRAVVIGAIANNASSPPSAANFVDADIAEIIFGVGSLPSAGEPDKLNGYAAHRWGLTGNLDAGHPYKYSPPMQSVTP